MKNLDNRIENAKAVLKVAEDKKKSDASEFNQTITNFILEEYNNLLECLLELKKVTAERDQLKAELKRGAE